MFYRRFETLCCERGLTPSQVCQMAGLHRTTHLTWRSGVTPSLRTLSRLALVLGTTVEYLDKGEKSVDGSLYDTYTRELLAVTSELDSNCKDTLLKVARALRINSVRSTMAAHVQQQ